MKISVKLFIALTFSIFITTMLSAQQTNKKVLSPEVYTIWKNISGAKISNDGKYVCYTVGPEKGDGYLYLYKVDNNKLDSISRGKNAIFSEDSRYLVFTISPQADTIRNMKLRKIAEDKLPKDSLGIWLFDRDTIMKIQEVTNFKISEESGKFFVYETSKEPKKNVSKPIDKKKKSLFSFLKKKKKIAEAPKKEKEQKGNTIVVFNPIDNKKTEINYVDNYALNYQGNSIAFIKNTELDSGSKTEVFRMSFDSLKPILIYSDSGVSENISINREGNKIAFLFAGDTSKTDKVFNLMYWSEGDKNARIIVDTASKGMIKNWSPSINNTPKFSKDNKRIFFGTCYKPIPSVKDTLLKEEKYSLDIWNYKDRKLQPQQLRQLSQEKRRTFLATYIFEKEKIVQLEDSALFDVNIGNDYDAGLGLGIDDLPYQKKQSWDVYSADYYIVDTYTGERTFFRNNFSGEVSISPSEKYLLFFDKADSSWYSYEIATKEYKNLTKSLKIPFYQEENDIPSKPDAYGQEGWYKDDAYVILKDRFDLWKIDPKNIEKPINLTKNTGRELQIRFNLINFDAKKHFYENTDTFFLTAFNENNKQSGFYLYDNSTKQLNSLVMGDYNYFYPVKSKNSMNYLYRKGSFKDYNDLYLARNSFQETIRISDANPQQKDYMWGTVEMISWKALDGQKLNGLLYKPENFDSTKQYPMIVYFYERYSDELHNHYIPKPSYSTINFTEYVSNGYLVFVPDITYKIGYPGKSAYNSIISGTNFLKKNSWVDPARIGLQGQSWGGYQVAWLVTQTNIFACAEAGAPVSNMTSAYGGIRWGSGVTRAFQYETGQSRIGTDLWKNRDLYIQNSPIFFADKVQTPLLIMANDGDGAVPWYQGIEYFCALRRLDKVVYMLTYNDDDHNLMKWPNRVDLSIRMMQFFDYYLKGKPQPLWMDQGIPAINKGKVSGYNLIETY